MTLAGRLVRSLAVGLTAGGWSALALGPVAGVLVGWLLALAVMLAPPYVTDPPSR